MEAATTISKHEKILVSGATGSLGREIVRQLLKVGLSPVAMVRPQSDIKELERLGVERRVADLRDRPALRAAFEGISFGIHTAAWISFRQNRLTQFTGINTFGAIDFYRSARAAGVRRVVHVSTVGTIGARPRSADREHVALMAEHDTFNLEHLKIPYIMSKRAAEHELAKLASEGAPELVIVNPTPILTDFPPGGLKRRLRARLQGPMLPRFDNMLSLVDVRDCAPAIVAALDRGCPGKRYILAGEPVPFDSILRHMGTILGCRPRLIRIPMRLLRLAAGIAAAWDRARGSSEIAFYPDLVRLAEYDWGYSSELARQELGFRPRSLNESLEDLLGTGFPAE